MIHKKFTSNFNRRLSAFNKNMISEDSMRYDLFAALLQSGLSTEKVILEHTHNHTALSKCEVDLVIDLKVTRIAFELKYFKQIPSGKADSTAYMAKFAIDLLKLHYFSANIKAKYFIFATDELMYKYIKNPNNGFSILHTTKAGECFQISAGDKTEKHYKDEISKVIPDSLSPFSTGLALKKIFYKPISNEHYIGCFRVF